MLSRASNILIAFGALAVFGGLCFIPAGLGEHGEGSLLGLAAGVCSLGILMIASGFYLKARALTTDAGNAKAREAGNARRRIRGGCDLCGMELPVIQCKAHRLNLCGNCLTQHYDFRSCVYTPSKRLAENKSKAMAAKGRGA
ncbi:MAG: hypothetical protein JOY93_04230 [Acidobacteriales bacterium]|nr:hypothetical protein [Terriglobales bacterium]